MPKTENQRVQATMRIREMYPAIDFVEFDRDTVRLDGRYNIEQLRSILELMEEIH